MNYIRNLIIPTAKIERRELLVDLGFHRHGEEALMANCVKIVEECRENRTPNHTNAALQDVPGARSSSTE